jgi:cytochrome c5
MAVTSRFVSKWLWAAGAIAATLGSAAGAFQMQAAKDTPLPPEMQKMPFEVRNGYRVFTKDCTKCHDAKRAETAKKTLFQWMDTIGIMRLKKGASIPLDDIRPIFLYLAYLQGTHTTPQQKDEYMTFLVKCENCHGVELVYFPKAEDGKIPPKMRDWPNIVHRMATKNRANIAPDDEKKIMGYIQRMHPDLFGQD